MKALLLAGLGGFIGASLRYAISHFMLPHTGNWKFPAATFLVNTAGCLIAGILLALSLKQDFLTHHARAFLFFGILGGFTTFSAFGLETVHLLQRQEIFWAGLYVSLTITVGVSALWLGMLSVK
ncbi:hypothetical protein BVX94_01800 [bacterium B17]|nr:hypothetical protein BVX94_01800 [bacterium B17]